MSRAIRRERSRTKGMKRDEKGRRVHIPVYVYMLYNILIILTKRENVVGSFVCSLSLLRIHDINNYKVYTV